MSGSERAIGVLVGASLALIVIGITGGFIAHGATGWPVAITGVCGATVGAFVGWWVTHDR